MSVYLPYSRYGYFVADNPIKIILISILITGLCSIGFMNFRYVLTT